jgi:hypothetical protein
MSVLLDQTGKVVIQGGSVLSIPSGINGQWWASNSPWNVPIPAGTFSTPMSNSATVTTAYRTAGGNVTQGFVSQTSTFTACLIVAPSGTGTVKWDFSYNGNWNFPLSPATGAVATAISNAASWFASNGDTDRSINVYSTDTGMMYDIYPDTQSTAGGNGPIFIVTASVRPLNGSGWWNQADFGTCSSGTASGGCQVGGSIKPSEWAAGVIPHALMGAYPNFLAGGNTSSPNAPNGFHFPATASDGTFGNSTNQLPHGSRLQLDPSLSASDLTTLGVPTAMLPVCVALQTYGWYSIDIDGDFSAQIKFLSTNPNATSGFNGPYTGATTIPLAIWNHMAWIPGPYVGGASGVGCGVAVTGTAGQCSYTKNFGSGDGLVHVGDIMTVYPSTTWSTSPGPGGLQGFNPTGSTPSWWDGIGYLVSAATSSSFTLQTLGGAAITSTVGNMAVFFSTCAALASPSIMSLTPYFASGV